MPGFARRELAPLRTRQKISAIRHKFIDLFPQPGEAPVNHDAIFTGAFQGFTIKLDAIPINSQIGQQLQAFAFSLVGVEILLFLLVC